MPSAWCVWTDDSRWLREGGKERGRYSLTPLMWGISSAVGTYVVPGEHRVHDLFSAGLCRDPWHRTANRSSSAISEHKDCCKHGDKVRTFWLNDSVNSLFSNHHHRNQSLNSQQFLTFSILSCDGRLPAKFIKIKSRIQGLLRNMCNNTVVLYAPCQFGRFS